MNNYDAVEKVDSVDGLPFVIKDGKYPGKWGGYKIEININGRDFIITTFLGVRGFNIPVEVLVENGEVWFK